MGYVLELEEELLMLLPGLISGIPSGLFGIAAFLQFAAQQRNLFAFYFIDDTRTFEQLVKQYGNLGSIAFMGYGNFIVNSVQQIRIYKIISRLFLHIFEY